MLTPPRRAHHRRPLPQRRASVGDGGSDSPCRGMPVHGRVETPPPSEFGRCPRALRPWPPAARSLPAAQKPPPAAARGRPRFEPFRSLLLLVLSPPQPGGPRYPYL